MEQGKNRNKAKALFVCLFEWTPGNAKAGECLSLKINLYYETIWKCILELKIFQSIQMKFKYAGLFPHEFTRWCWAWSTMHLIKEIDITLKADFLRCTTLHFYTQKIKCP